MRLPIPSSRTRRIRKKAGEWQLEMLEPTTPQRRAEFETWLAADPEHAREYAILDSYSTLGIRLPSPVRHERRNRFLSPAYGLATAAIVAVVGAVLITGRESPAAYAAVTNPGPAVRMVRLADGSTIVLDINTDLSVALKPRTREVEMHSGRARFKVAPDPKRPFIVSSASGQVISHQGEFDVDVRQQPVRVMPLTGSVAVQPEGAKKSRTLSLSSGEAAPLESGNPSPISVPRDDRLWPVGRVSFDRTPLANIIASANRFGGRPIHVADDSIGALRVTAVLDLRDTAALARKLAAALDLNVQESANGILLTR